MCVAVATQASYMTEMYDGRKCRVNAGVEGGYFEEQWSYVFQQRPEFVFITGT
jgi:hypothetical protein